MTFRYGFFAALLGMLLCTGLPRSGPVQAAEPSDWGAFEDDAQLQAEIRHWIETLGHDSYAQRVRAKSELQRMGLLAFDLLYEASTHPDNEVAIAARHLLSRLQISWTHPDDPPQVQEVFEGYGDSPNEAERRTHIQRLAELPDRIGLRGLCRVVRFESSLRLSRDAALLIMRQPLLSERAQQQRSADTINGLMGANRRPAARWLRVYADDLRRGVYDADRWRELIARERSQAEGRRSLQADPDAVLELVRVCAVRAQQADNHDEALRLGLETLEMIPPGRKELIEAATWALDHQLYSVVIQMQQRQPIPFRKDPMLLYAVAEAYQAQGEPARAERLATTALAIDPLPDPSSEAAEAMSRDALENLALRHREIGVQLQNRGQFQWAIGEYQHIVEHLEVDMVVAAITRWQLARLHGGLLQHEEVLQTLQPLSDRMERDKDYRRRLQNTLINPDSIEVRMLRHRGLLAAERGNYVEAYDCLTAARARSPEDANILIALYRLPKDTRQEDRVQDWINKLESRFAQHVQQTQRAYRQRNSSHYRLALAEALNQHAWLVSNTFGDYEQALRNSLRSLELQPDDPMLLDTCARCFFAVEDYDRAVAYQQRAVRLGGADPAVHRQLAEFLAARAAAKAEAS